jgi:hypothetical protein
MLHGARDDERLVARAMHEVADTDPHDGPLTDPSFIWWKAQRLRRLEAEREATASIEVGDYVHLGAALLGAAALAAGAWDSLPALSLDPTMRLLLAVGAVALLSLVAFAAVEAVRER